MMSSGTLNGTPLSMKLTSKPARRLSISFDSVRNPDRDLFVRRDRDILANELAEIFSFIEIIELANGRRMIQRMGWEADDANLDKTNSVFELLLRELQDADQNRRSCAAEVLCVFMMGLAAVGQRSEIEKLHEGSRISQALIRLGLLSDIIRCLCTSVASIARLHLIESDHRSLEAFYSTSREIRLCFNILLISMILLPDEPQVREMLSLNLFDNKHIIVFCLDMVSSDNADLLPLKKALMMIRHALLSYDCGIKVSKFGDDYLKKIKSRRRDVFQISKHIAEHFGPILCIPNSAHLNGIELVTFSRTPTALVEQINMARNAIHVGYADTDDILSEGVDQPPNIKGVDHSEMLYRLLHPRLQKYVVGILKVFLSIAPNVRPSAQLINGFRELQISASNTDSSSSIERSRHTEILTKNISFIILSLLKTFRKGHPLQFSTLLCLLQDKNSLVLILKFLNQNLSASLFKRNEIPSLSLFKINLLSLDQSTIIVYIKGAKGSLNERCWRKYSAYLNMLRILQKITKNSPRQIRSLVKFRAPEILIRLLDIPQSDIVIYTLKLLKNQVAFTDGKWRAENVDIISAIFLHIRIDLFDKWLEPKPSSDDILEIENSLAKSIRQRCHIFNSQQSHDDSKPALYQLRDNASECEFLEAALAEHPHSLTQEFKMDWRKWFTRYHRLGISVTLHGLKMLQCGCFGREEQVHPMNEDAYSRSIDRQSHIGRIRDQNVIKLLLLGTGESGKSTFVKQLLTIYGTGFSMKERMEYKTHIFANALLSIKVLLNAVEKFQIQSSLDPAVRNYLLNVEVDLARIDQNIGDMIEVAWADPAVRKAYERKNQFQLNDSASYFLNKVHLIVSESFVPTNEDIMMIRVASTGIVEREFQNKHGAVFRIIDVGGQRNERRKWIHCFDSVTAIIFVVALSEYDQTLYEDDKMNRMVESLTLFGDICNSPYFVHRPIILFLNKVDLFQEKLKTSDLSKIFPEYNGGADVESAAQFIKEKFENTHLNNASNPIMTYITCNTDPKNVQVVFEALAQILLRNALMEAGIVI